jgi:hypothetical protein
MTEPCSFKFVHYRETLERAKQAGYLLLAFRDFKEEAQEKMVILRHDLDYGRCVEKCLHFADMEQDLGATATYFVRVHCPEYNPFEYRTYQVLRKLLEMGHEVGLHFEAVDMAHVTGEDEVEIFRREKAVLEQILGIQIRSGSQHGDFSRHSLLDDHLFFERHSKEPLGLENHADEERFFTRMKYLSDSNSIWREGCFCNHIGRYERIQVLTHPKWWFSENYHTW